MPAMKTPGVYIVEKNAFPNSVVEVATAVPAFVGYTEKAVDNGKPLLGKPFRISSLAEFERYYGYGPPVEFDIRAPKDGEESDFQTENGTPYVIDLTSEHFRLYYAMRHFYQNGGGPCWIVSVGDYYGGELDDAPPKPAAKAGDKATAGKDPVPPPSRKIGTVGAKPLGLGLKTLELEQEPTLIVIPDAVELAVDDCIALQQQMLMHCGVTMKNRFAILDVWGATGGRAQDNPEVKAFRAKLGVNNLMYGAAYYPWVHTRILTETDLTYLNFPKAKFSTLLTDTPPAFEPVRRQAELSDDDWAKELDKAKEAKEAAKDEDQKEWISSRKDQTNKGLVQASPLYQTILKLAVRKLNLMPPSAAMAGLYTMVDNARGVWKAPANVSINNAVEPAVSISHADQESLNVDPQGKSINAIRSFIGEGVLVWGARTLDGNSLDWRYINVRRTMIMLEESCRLAAKAMVFEPNVAGTWLTIKSMIQNFLVGIWRRGGLAGAVPDDAFSVHCGLGETMTSEDILEGILRVTVLVAISRPAEFIEITFQQQMQKS